MEKNKVFQNKINKKINNNQKILNIKESLKNNNLVIENDVDLNKSKSIDINEKINRLLNRNGYTFNVNVEIITNKEKYNTRIAGKVNNCLITLDNDVIYIPDIKDIIIKN